MAVILFAQKLMDSFDIEITDAEWKSLVTFRDLFAYFEKIQDKIQS
jgi:acyl carrier protein